MVGNTEEETSEKLIKHDCFDIKNAKDMTLDELLREIYNLQQAKEIKDHE